MTRFRLGTYTAFALSFLALIIPHVTFAAASYLPIVAQQGTTCYCIGSAPDYGCVMQIVQNIINAAIQLGVILCVAYIGYAGFSLMLARGNPQALVASKHRLLNAVLGMAIILSSWIVVDFVVKAIYNPNVSYLSVTFGPWNELLAPSAGSECIKINQTPDVLATGVVGSFGSSPSAQYGTAGGTGGSGGGSCTAPDSGACSVAALQGTCFGSRAAEAAKVCNLESAGGNPSIKSGSDMLNGGSGPSYSIGLWQINLTTSTVGGLNCPAAFTAKCQGSALIKSHPGWCTASIKPDQQALYNSCVAAAQTPALNDAEACKLFNSRGFQPWSYSSNKCGVPYTE